MVYCNIHCSSPFTSESLWFLYPKFYFFICCINKRKRRRKGTASSVCLQTSKLFMHVACFFFLYLPLSLSTPKKREKLVLPSSARDRPRTSAASVCASTDYTDTFKQRFLTMMCIFPPSKSVRPHTPSRWYFIGGRRRWEMLGPESVGQFAMASRTPLPPENDEDSLWANKWIVFITRQGRWLWYWPRLCFCLSHTHHRTHPHIHMCMYVCPCLPCDVSSHGLQ